VTKRGRGTKRGGRSGEGGSDGRIRRGTSRPGPLPGPLVLLLLALLLLPGCSPTYVLKAGWVQARILAARQPIPQVIQDPDTDPGTRGKLSLVLEARDFARELGMEVGGSYTTFVQLDSDTLANILSAAHQDRLAPRTWWFPVVGRMPYKGFFRLDDALREERKLQEQGFDTWIRPTAAFSTLGWFSDPVMSTLLRYDEVGLVETILHEIAHQHLFVPGQGRFNESFATWVGNAAAIRFFCTRAGGGEDTVWCGRARDRWADAMTFSVFLDGLLQELDGVYSDPERSREEKLSAREVIFQEAVTLFRDEVQPTFLASTYSGFLQSPLNNATLLSRMLYYHRLPDFQALQDRYGGDFMAAVEVIREGVAEVSDPFQLLPKGGVAGDG